MELLQRSFRLPLLLFLIVAAAASSYLISPAAANLVLNRVDRRVRFSFCLSVSISVIFVSFGFVSLRFPSPLKLRQGRWSMRVVVKELAGVLIIRVFFIPLLEGRKEIFSVMCCMSLYLCIFVLCF
jgi:hypothetical protein